MTWTPLTLGLAIVWGIFTVGLIILLIYRSTLTMHEDDQLFLDESQSAMEQEQIQLMKRVNSIAPYLKVLGALSGAMILVMAGMAIYQGLNPPQ